MAVNKTKIEETNLSYKVEIPKISDEGYLCFGEGERNIPFEIKRFYYIFDVKNGATRGKHAHKQNLQMLFCIKGRVKIILDDGSEKEEVILDKPNEGVFLNKMIWHEMVDFSDDAMLLIFASEYYDEGDYIRDYKDFLSLTRKMKTNSWQDWISPILGGKTA